MAVETFGNNIVGAFTGGVPVTAIYAGSTKVWPMSGPVPGDYYLEWWPKDISGSFYIGGQSRRLEDYSGYYSGPFISVSVRSVYYTAIDSGAFNSDRYPTGITSVETTLPYIGEFAFNHCYRLSAVSLPFCERISHHAFAGCSALLEVSLPACSNLNEAVFNGCINLSKVSLPSCKYINDTAFGGCSALSEVNLPVCSYIGSFAFFECINLSNVSLPSCEYIGSWAFESCKLSVLSLPVCSYIGGFAFQSCSELLEVNLPVCSHISSGAFASCSKLREITLEYSSVCLLGAGAFNYTSIYYGSGSIYVPSSLVSAYKADSMWSSLRSVIHRIPS